MAIKIKIPKERGEDGKKLTGLPRDPVVRAALILFLVLAVVHGCFSYFYIKYDRIIERRFRTPVFSNSAKIYAIPQTVRDGEKIGAKEIAADLRRAGYSDKEGKSKLGSFRLAGAKSRSLPARSPTTARKRRASTFEDGKVDRITSKGNELSAYELEPQLITALFDAGAALQARVGEVQPDSQGDGRGGAGHRRPAFFRARRREFRPHGRGRLDRPDPAAPRARRFDPHHAAFARLLSDAGENGQAQVDRDADCRRARTEVQQAADFRVLCQLGEPGAARFVCHQWICRGVARLFQQRPEGHHAAGSRAAGGNHPAPSYLSPYRHPERALERRNLVLDAMVDTHAITREQADKAKATPLKLAPPNVEASDAPYFVDMVRDTLINKFNERDLNDEALPHLHHARSRPAESRGPGGRNRASSWWMSR